MYSPWQIISQSNLNLQKPKILVLAHSAEVWKGFIIYAQTLILKMTFFLYRILKKMVFSLRKTYKVPPQEKDAILFASAKEEMAV